MPCGRLRLRLSVSQLTLKADSACVNPRLCLSRAQSTAFPLRFHCVPGVVGFVETTTGTSGALVLIGQACRATKKYVRGFGFGADTDRGCKVSPGILEGGWVAARKGLRECAGRGFAGFSRFGDLNPLPCGFCHPFLSRGRRGDKTHH
jgi:hypothetical protein